jgi:hypothetical protein
VTLSGLTYDTTYSWQVQALSAGGVTYANSGSWWSFTTTPPVSGVALAIAPPTSMVYVGQTFDLAIQVQAGTQFVDGVAAYLDFNPSLLQVTQITNGAALPLELQKQYSNAAGTVDYAAGALSNFPSGTFTVATVTFGALAQSSGTSVCLHTAAPRQSDVTYGGTSLLPDLQCAIVVISNNATLVGSVTLQGRPARPHASWSVPLTASFTLQGQSTPAYTLPLTTDSMGVFTATSITPGTYTVKVKNSHTLQNVYSTTLSAGVSTFDFGTLREGDANNDNYVTLVDFSILASTFGKCMGDPGYDDRADFNEDQCVSLLDFSLLASNFGQAGDAVAGLQDSDSQPTAPSAGNALIVVYPTTSTVAIGDVFTVTVQLQSGSQLVDGAQASLDFDPTLLQVKSLTGNSAAFPLVLQSTFSNTAGTIDYAAGTLSNFPSGDISLVQIQFEVIGGPASTPLSFHYGLPRQTDVTYGGASILAGASGRSVVIEQEHSVYLPVAIR